MENQKIFFEKKKKKNNKKIENVHWKIEKFQSMKIYKNLFFRIFKKKTEKYIFKIFKNWFQKICWITRLM